MIQQSISITLPDNTEHLSITWKNKIQLIISPTDNYETYLRCDKEHKKYKVQVYKSVLRS